MKLIVGNFKMNMLNGDINEYIDEIKKYSFSNVVYCPSNIFLKDFISNNLTVGAQDLSPFENGAYTGDISASQMKSIGVKYAIIGHSERRKHYCEKEILIDKLKMAINNDIIPIYCIGETKEEYDNDLTLDVLKKEIDYIFKFNINLENLIIAYEPLWSIGTGLIPTTNEIEKVIDYIKKYINDKYQFQIKVLYGGSVNNENINELENIKNVNGYLIGGCSIKVHEFIKVIECVNN